MLLVSSAMIRGLRPAGSNQHVHEERTSAVSWATAWLMSSGWPVAADQRNAALQKLMCADTDSSMLTITAPQLDPAAIPWFM
ncbi:hypothetical protein [Sorangium sp. So ce296]|uniref:hypothetical protein n=1 Tax=Sorangium sp. So ce296 TaxID=3133296 RepID=UPI003F645CDE